MDESFAESAFLDIAGRVARKLLELAELHGEQTRDGIRIGMRSSQGTIAGMVAASRESVNRSLSRFASEGLIRRDSRSINERSSTTLVFAAPPDRSSPGTRRQGCDERHSAGAR